MISKIVEAPRLNLRAVVCGTDFSVFSKNAGLYSALLAKHFSAKLLLAHAFTLSQAAMDVEAERSLLSQQRKDLAALLAQRASELSSDSFEVIPVLIEGEPKRVVPELADKNAPALIVLGTHGGGRISREIIGSTAEGVLRSTSWPCLTVGPHVKPASAETLPFRRILYVTDLSPAAAGAAAYAASLAEAFHADVDVLHVVKRGIIDHPGRLNDLEGHFYRSLEAVVPQQAEQFCHSRTFVEVGNAHHQILQHVTERSIDLLVMGLRKSSHLSIETRKSGAFQVMVHATCPVLTLVG